MKTDIADEDDQVSSPLISFENDADSTASGYAWEFFKYHAQQRQAVFRFYLIIVGATFTGLASLDGTETGSIARWAFGSILIIASFLFWRLDRRNLKFIKISEEFIMTEEERLAKILKNEKTRIISKIREMKRSVFPLSLFTSFQQIYRSIFLIVAAIGLILVWTDAREILRNYRLTLDYNGFNYSRTLN